MKTSIVHLGGLAVLGISASFTVLAAPPTSATRSSDGEEPAALTAAAEPIEEDVTDRIEIETTGTLRSDRSGKLFTGLTVRNVSEEDLGGRLVVVIDSTGVEGVDAALEDGRLAGGAPFVEVLPEKGILKPSEKTRSIRVEFKSDQFLTAQARRDFTLSARVFRVGPSKTEVEPRTARRSNEPLIPGKKYSQAELDHVMAIQTKWTPELLSKEGVVGTGTAEDADGNLVIEVYALRHGVKDKLPAKLDGVPVQPSITGDIFRAGPAWDRVVHRNGRKVALPNPKGRRNRLVGGDEPGNAAGGADEGVDDVLEPIPEPTESGNLPPGLLESDPLATVDDIPADPADRFDRPVPIGVSLFNLPDVCASGTLGARVIDPDGNFYILSNAHVISREGTGIIGDEITQPGCGDVGLDNLDDVLATLTDFQPIYPGPSNTVLGPPNHIDASIALIADPNDELTPEELVLARTPADGYGFPSSTPVPPRIGMKVQKYGRTTGLRRGTIKAINVSTIVGYNNIGPSYFTGQITIIGEDTLFSQPGDSGSLIVTQDGNHPVGLLFAGSGSQTVANPIQLVLQRFNVAIDDGTSTAPATGPGRTPAPGRTGRMGFGGGSDRPPIWLLF